MRLFVAMNFDESARRQLAAMRDAARAGCPRANFTRDENLHLTLAFLGEVPSERIPDIRRAMRVVSGSPVRLKFGGREALGGGLLCLAVKPDHRLYELQESLSEALRAADFVLENRAFRPHITLAREYHAQPMPEFAPFDTVARRVSLMKSERIGGWLTYTELHSVILR